MPHPFWPLFDLEVHTPRLTLRYIDDELGAQLIRLALDGIHPPDFMPFSVPWTDLERPDFERRALDFYWRNRSATPASWNILFAALVDGEVVGSTNLGAAGFPVKRWFETGSWLGLSAQGQGLGKELRVATLHLGFLAFDALMAGTAAYADNAQSLGVTKSLGYEPNGIEHHERRGELALIERYRMTREEFITNVRRDDVEIVGDEAARELLGLTR